MVLTASYLDIDKQQSSRIWSELYNWCFGSVKLRYITVHTISLCVLVTWQYGLHDSMVYMTEL